MPDYILVIDQSTTASKAYLISRQGHILDRQSMPHAKLFPKEGWSEHDPMEILENVKACLKQLIFRNPYTIRHICAIAITNQRESVLIWDTQTGKPIYPAIVWQCTRTSDLCAQMKEEGKEDIVLEKTGLKIDPYFSATKAKWILDHVPGARENLDHLALGTIDSWLVWNLDLNHNHFTDHTNASRTLLYNLHTQQWDPELCALFDIDPCLLPVIQVSDAIFGATDLDGLLERPVPITGVIGDSQAAFYAQECRKPGQTKMTLGTGSSIITHAPDILPGVKALADSGLVQVLGYKTKDKSAMGLEAIVNCNGECLNWAKDELELFQHYEEINEALFEKDHAPVFVPALTGLGIPVWNADARGMFVFMDRGTSRKDLLAALCDGILCQLADATGHIESDVALKVDGGLAKNPVLMQRLADLCRKPIEVSVHEDLSAMGAWMSAVEGLGWDLEWNDRPVLRYEPQMPLQKRDEILDRYHDAIDAALYLAQKSTRRLAA